MCWSGKTTIALLPRPYTDVASIYVYIHTKQSYIHTKQSKADREDAKWWTNFSWPTVDDIRFLLSK